MNLKQILNLAHELEKAAKDTDFPEAMLLKFQSCLLECQFSEHPQIQKLAEISDHLHPKMTLKHFYNFLVPIERLANQTVQDDQFLISKSDAPNKTIQRKDLIFILDNIRSAFNVGSIFRMADGVGAKVIFLCGYTPTPEQQILTKTTMGAHDFVEWRHFQKLEDAMLEAKSMGYQVISLETSPQAKSIYQIGLKGPTAFVVGNERFGLEQNILKTSDEVRHIPLSGVKNSLNVANSLSVAAFEWNRQNFEADQ